MASGLESKDLALYTGVSNRTRGWKSRKNGEFMEGRVPHHSNIKRWDGAARMSYNWDSLRRDPELWYRGGNCFVHLYGKGQSRRGPAFKVPFSALVAAKCLPLIDRFASRDAPESPGSDRSSGNGNGGGHSFDLWTRARLLGKVDLYIPAPASADKDESFMYHIATRNLFAWIFRRSVVGEYLGTSLISLLNSMHEFRAPGMDNMADMINYLDEEGYLDMRNEPSHALAVLHLAEVFQIRDLYIDAFAHCTGMSDRLFLSPEYLQISSASRKLLRRARVEMDLRLGRAGIMLTTFMEDELSEANLGLTAGARAHLDRFRTFLLSFYTSKLGYYPPGSIDPRSTIFEPSVYQVLREDFESLYEYLVDDGFTTAESSPFLAQGGICTLQSVHSFDLRYSYKSLDHPLPLLPEIAPPVSSRRLSWLPSVPSLSVGGLSVGGRDKLRPDQRLLTHAALVKASNHYKATILDNDLVRAYRKFEEESVVSPMKADRHEKVSAVDARKVRWILVYSIYQTLRNITDAPAEVRDPFNLTYNVAISTASLPPWKQEETPMESLVRTQTDMALSRSGSTSTGWSSVGVMGLSTETPPPMPEIKPDIDYFALTHRQQELLDAAAAAAEDAAAKAVPERAARPVTSRGNPSRPPITGQLLPKRSRSLTRGISLNRTVRRSLSLFSGRGRSRSRSTNGRPGGDRSRDTSPAVAQGNRNSTYHEIVVLGYGNGTNAVSISTPSTPQTIRDGEDEATLSGHGHEEENPHRQHAEAGSAPVSSPASPTTTVATVGSILSAAALTSRSPSTSSKSSQSSVSRAGSSSGGGEKRTQQAAVTLSDVTPTIRPAIPARTSSTNSTDQVDEAPPPPPPLSPARRSRRRETFGLPVLDTTGVVAGRPPATTRHSMYAGPLDAGPYSAVNARSRSSDRLPLTPDPETTKSAASTPTMSTPRPPGFRERSSRRALDLDASTRRRCFSVYGAGELTHQHKLPRHAQLLMRPRPLRIRKDAGSNGGHGDEWDAPGTAAWAGAGMFDIASNADEWSAMNGGENGEDGYGYTDEDRWQEERLHSLMMRMRATVGGEDDGDTEGQLARHSEWDHFATVGGLRGLEDTAVPV